MIDLCQRHELDGFIFASLHVKSGFLPFLKKSAIPFVSIGLGCPGVASVRIDYSNAYCKIFALIELRGANIQGQH